MKYKSTRGSSRAYPNATSALGLPSEVDMPAALKRIRHSVACAAIGLVWVCGAAFAHATAAVLPSDTWSPPVGAPAGHSTRIILLGTGGGPIDRKDRAQPATLLVVDGRPYLIDAGAGVVRQIDRAGFQPYRIGHIFFTHYHLDHNSGLPALMSYIWIDRNMHADRRRPCRSTGRPQPASWCAPRFRT